MVHRQTAYDEIVMRKLARPVLMAFACLWFSTDGFAMEILALGTSVTDGKGVDRDKIYPVKLQEILRSGGVDAVVVNAGVDGDAPIFMLQRLQNAIGPNTRLVIFEPGSNDTKTSNLEYAEKILAYLEAHNVPTIYVSGLFQTRDEAKQMADKYHAYYYGGARKGVPVDEEHFQFDSLPAKKGVGAGHLEFNLGKGGHMTAAGCELLAKQMAPLVERVLKEKNIH